MFLPCSSKTYINHETLASIAISDYICAVQFNNHMKSIKQIVLVLLLMCSMPAIAQWVPTANLTIFSEDGLKFYLVLNGERYNDVPQTNIRIEELPNPYYNCKIIFADKTQPDISKNALMLADANGVMQDVTYRIKRDNKGKNVLRYYSFVPAQQNMMRPANCATYRFGAPNIMIGAAPTGYSNTSATTIQQNTIGTAGNVQVNVGGVGVNVNLGTPAGATMTTTTTTTTSSYNSNYNNNSYNNNQNNSGAYNNRNSANYGNNCNMPMNNMDFEDAKRSINASNFDETRLSTAKQIISSNCMNTNQITALLKLFSFEESKLDFAKYAYAYCLDRNNYYKVGNAFTFESSKTELTNYVQSMR